MTFSCKIIGLRQTPAGKRTNKKEALNASNAGNVLKQ